MKQKIFGFLRKKPVKRGIRTALCLLLALMAAASDVLPILPPTEAEAADELVLNSGHTLYIWQRGFAGYNLYEDGWTPVLISYKGKDSKGNTKEYFLNTKGKSLTSDKYIEATEWSSLASKKGYPTLNGGVGETNYRNAQNVFWTVDDPLTDVAVFWSGEWDAEYEEYRTWEIGRNIDWSNYRDETAAGEYLVCDASNIVNFAKPDSFFYKKCEHWRPDSFKWFTIIGEDEHPMFSTDRPDAGLEFGEIRIFAQHDDAGDSCLYPYENYFYFGGFSSFDYDGKFSVWTAERVTLPTVENTHKTARLGCTDSLDSASSFEPDVVVHNGQLFKISNDIRIAENAVLLIEPGGTLTIDATVWNDGYILNYGTIFIREGGCIRPLYSEENNSYSQDKGRILCSGKYEGKLTGEGNLIMFKQSAVIFNQKINNMFTVRDGASVEMNGTMISPDFFQLIDSDFHVRESGRLICQYELTNRFTESKYLTTEFNESKIVTKQVNKTQTPIPIYEKGSFQFINDGRFIKLTEPGTSLPDGLTVTQFNAKAIGFTDYMDF